MTRSSRTAIAFAAAALTASCTLGPNYNRPDVRVPATFRDVAPPAAAPSPASLADVQWFDLFHDDRLTELVNAALRQKAADLWEEVQTFLRQEFAGS